MTGASAAEGKGAQTRRAVLAAAIAAFGQDGYRTTSVARIAREAGVGPTVPYAYFPGKEALFLAAVDEDAAALIDRTIGAVLDEPGPDWPQRLLAAVLAGLPDRPLARRLLAGREPDVTARVLQVPALEALRTTCADRLRADQAAGVVRRDLDPTATANGVVTLVLSLLMALVQVGPEVGATYGDDVAAVLRAAIEPPTTAG